MASAVLKSSLASVSRLKVTVRSIQEVYFSGPVDSRNGAQREWPVESCLPRAAEVLQRQAPAPQGLQVSALQGLRSLRMLDGARATLRSCSARPWL
jgi:hypothetical protein